MNNSYNKLSIAIIIIAIIAAVFLYRYNNLLIGEISQAQENEKAINNLLEKIQLLDRNIEDHYGRASDIFYANKPLIVLNGDETGIVWVYYKNYKASDLSVWYNGSIFNIDEFVVKDDTWMQCSFTPKVSSGYYTLRFENKVTKKEFKVLVIIK